MRKEKEITINDRERKLTFVIREMPAIELDSWLTRAALLSPSIVEKNNGQTDFSITGAGVAYEDLRPLMDEMLACCHRIDAGVEQRCTPQNVEGFIQDVRTIITLRREALQLNLGFMWPEPEKGSGCHARDNIDNTCAHGTISAL